MTELPAAPARGPCVVAPDGVCEFISLGEFDDKSGKVGPVQVIQCRHCRMGVTTPALPDAAFLYEDRESQDFQPGTSELARTLKVIAFRRQARQLLAQLPAAAGKVLDFGCGSGLFTRCLGDALGCEAVTGADFHTDPPSELIDRRYMPIARLRDSGESFDTVLAMHVLEHDDDAFSLLGRIASTVRPGGTIVLEVPNIDCVWTGVFGRAWDAWYLPFHRTHFSAASLRGLAQRQGLELLDLRAVSVPTMGRSLANLFGGRNSLPFLLAGAALHPVQLLGEKLTRRSSALRLIARRA